MPPRKRPVAGSYLKPETGLDPAMHLAPFLRYQEAELGMAQNSLLGYGSDLKQFVDWFKKHGFESVSTVDLKLLSAYLAHLNERGLSPQSVARHLASLKMFFRYLMIQGIIRDSVVDLVNSPKLWQKLPHVMSPRMVDRLLAAPDGADRYMLRDRSLLSLLYATGCRASEVVNLKLHDVHLDESYCRCVGKGNRERLVFLNPLAIRSLRSYLTHERPVLAGRMDTGELFVSKSGAMTRRAVWSLVKKYAQRAGVGDKVSPHTLRHSFATHMMAAGAEIRALQELLGHASITTTQIYTHVDHSRLKAVHRKCHPRG